MKTSEVRYTVVIDESDLPALFDMMRYEGARLLSWNRASIERPLRGIRPGWAIELASTNYTPDRWASFMISPKVAHP